MAIEWLERRLELAGPKELVAVRLRLARAQLKADKTDEAIYTLQSAFDDAPRNTEVSKLLLGLYRKGSQWRELADTLTVAIEHAAEKETVIAYANEVAAIAIDKLKTPSIAVKALEKAISVAPTEKHLRTVLAQGLLEDERYEEARINLTALIEEFGRCRSVERAKLHLLLAKVARGQDNHDEAIDQLEAASKMDSNNLFALQNLSELAREAGQLARAERSYRALLMKVRRRPSKAPTDADPTPATIGPSEILIELSRIAKKKSDVEQADELIESALDSLDEFGSDDQLQQSLFEREDWQLLERVIRRRLESIDTPRRRSILLTDLAMLLSEQLGRPEDGLDVQLEALIINPGYPPLHDATRKMCPAIKDGEEQYRQTLENLLEQNRRDGDAFVRCELLLRIGECLEQDTEELDKAQEF